MTRAVPVALCVAVGVTGCAPRPRGSERARAPAPIPPAVAMPSGAPAVESIDAGPAPDAPSDAPAHAAEAPWTPPPPGASVLVFRELLVGWLPHPSRRNTWTLISSGRHVILRFEAQWSAESFTHVDRSSHDPGRWLPAVRVEYAGDALRASPLAATLTRTFGPDDFGPTPRHRTNVSATIALACAAKPIAVHPAFAALVEGWKNEDETMEPASWAPSRTETVRATSCTVRAADDSLRPTLPFSEGLHFVAGRKTAKEETAGVEWAFVNSDMVVQDGGFRWIPAFAAR